VNKRAAYAGRTKPKPADIAKFDEFTIQEVQFFLACAKRAIAKKAREIERDNQPKASPEAGRGPGKPGGS